jgi:hypothetical protein
MRIVEPRVARARECHAVLHFGGDEPRLGAREKRARVGMSNDLQCRAHRRGTATLARAAS